jgi:hypothetical protein
MNFLPSYTEFTTLLNLFKRVNETNFDVKNNIVEYCRYIISSPQPVITVEIEWVQYCHKLHPIVYMNDMKNRSCSLSTVELFESSEKQMKFLKKIIQKYPTLFLNQQLLTKTFDKWLESYLKFVANANPTPDSLEIDFIWHLHMQNNHKYIVACKYTHNTMINHRFLEKDLPSKEVSIKKMEEVLKGMPVKKMEEVSVDSKKSSDGIIRKKNGR